MIRPLIMLALAVAAAPAGLRAQDPVRIVGRAGQVYRTLASLQADFVQTIQDRAQGDTLVSRGTVIQAGNNNFAMRFTDPPGEAIVIDGKYIWTYTPSTAPNQVFRAPIPTDPVYGANFLAALLDRPADRYDVAYVRRDTAAGQPTDVVELTPKSNSIPFSRARLWLGVEDALPRRIELDEAPGFRRIVELRRLRPNVAYSRRTFTFTVPPGIRVIDQL